MDNARSTIQLRHGIRLPAEIAWKYLFTNDFDQYYMKNTSKGSCEELESGDDHESGVVVRKTKIIPVIGNSQAEKFFIQTISRLFNLDKISYITSQTKCIQPNASGLYLMKFTNSDYYPDIADIQSSGTVELQPIPGHPDKSLMVTHIDIRVGSIKFKPFQSQFENAARQATDDVFHAMIRQLIPYHKLQSAQDS